jgi:hypothetical protein
MNLPLGEKGNGVQAEPLKERLGEKQEMGGVEN